jgi:cytoskeletal protein RodZ
MQTIGKKLKATREAKRLTLEKVFEATRIRLPYLQALEADDLSAMPSPVQARGYLRNYAEFLGLNFDQLLEEMRASSVPADEMITPMDATPPLATPTPEPVPPPEATIQPPRKPARRKKADSQPATESTPSKPRRGRKKVEPEPVLDSQPETVEPIQEPESVVEQIVEDAPLQEPPPHNVSDGIWQSWLNRLSSVISRRVKPGEDSQSESETPRVDEETSQPSNPSIAQHSGQRLQPDNLQPTGAAQGKPSIEIFKEIGLELRKRREMLSLHLTEVERNTHVKAHYLEALEAGATDKLPSTVQTRGMLSNYATFLDLDVDAILLRFADALQARHREKNPQKPGRDPGQPILSNIPPLRSFIAGDLVFGIGIAILLVGFLIWGITWIVNRQNQEEIQPTAPSISDVLLATADPSQFTPTATLALIQENEPTVTIVIPTQNLNVNVQVNLIAVERTYLRVIVDGEEVFNGRVLPGNAYPFEAEEQVEVLVGSGAAIRITYNGRDLGLLGGFGQVVSNIYREEEIVTPTALPTQPPTITFTPTATVPASQTPVPSNTPATTGTP